MLQAGRVIEDGSPDQLMRGNGFYRRLVQREVNRLSRTAA
jgi:ATP-binding cassette subfamily B protein